MYSHFVPADTFFFHSFSFFLLFLFFILFYFFLIVCFCWGFFFWYEIPNKTESSCNKVYIQTESLLNLQ